MAFLFLYSQTKAPWVKIQRFLGFCLNSKCPLLSKKVHCAERENRTSLKWKSRHWKTDGRKPGLVMGQFSLECPIRKYLVVMLPFQVKSYLKINSNFTTVASCFSFFLALVLKLKFYFGVTVCFIIMIWTMPLRTARLNFKTVIFIRLWGILFTLISLFYSWGTVFRGSFHIFLCQNIFIFTMDYMYLKCKIFLSTLTK